MKAFKAEEMEKRDARDRQRQQAETKSKILFEKADLLRSCGEDDKAIALLKESLQSSLHMHAHTILREHYKIEFKPICYPYDGIEEDEFEPAEWNWPVDEKDDDYKGPMHCYQLSMYYARKVGCESGRMVPFFYTEETFKWMKKAADMGDSPAQQNLAMAYLNGWFNLPKDKDQAIHYLMLAADMGDETPETAPIWTSKDYPDFDE